MACSNIGAKGTWDADVSEGETAVVMVGDVVRLNVTPTGGNGCGGDVKYTVEPGSPNVEKVDPSTLSKLSPELYREMLASEASRGYGGGVLGSYLSAKATGTYLINVCAETETMGYLKKCKSVKLVAVDPQVKVGGKVAEIDPNMTTISKNVLKPSYVPAGAEVAYRVDVAGLPTDTSPTYLWLMDGVNGEPASAGEAVFRDAATEGILLRISSVRSAEDGVQPDTRMCARML